MQPTKYSLAEQALLRIQAGFPSTADNVKIFDLIIAVGQKLNSLLKTQYLSETLGIGEAHP